jgi:hypothetical protein
LVLVSIFHCLVRQGCVDGHCSFTMELVHRPAAGCTDDAITRALTNATGFPRCRIMHVSAAVTTRP